MDFAIFEHIEDDDECHGDTHEKCKAVDRIITALRYYQQLVLSANTVKYGKDPRAVFNTFCNDLYPKGAMLNDYIHWVMNHKDEQSMKAIRKQLNFVCDSAKNCGATTRHYRDRTQDGNGGDETESSWFTEQMDRVHFNIYHLHELGLRVSAEVLESEVGPDDDEKQDESHLFDLAMKRMAREMKEKRGIFGSERLNGSANAKFALKVDGAKESDGMYPLSRWHFVYFVYFSAQLAISQTVYDLHEFHLFQSKRKRKRGEERHFDDEILGTNEGRVGVECTV